ncbi:hypothetical protein CYY_007782 [Polysphondylium violaceum]|uniref:Transmembrane protein 19 n=1 Tax=Polysphondylium violaceum TaxID=133409 RepID=A0A8J4PP62_9MYCE|nr:hypothetical protein CYY_007782 [Polysphondylium violaceum]
MDYIIDTTTKEGAAIGRLPLAFLIVSFFGIHGYRKGSLSLSGLISAWLVGMISCYSSWTIAVTLLTFYYSSSKLTKYKAKIKKALEDNHTEGGNRNYIQVFSNSLSATIYAIMFFLYTNRLSTIINYNYDYFGSFLLCAIIGHYACCNGDTWASELGILSKSQPILITTLKRVPKGTNGGISKTGILASLSGGLLIGVFYYLATITFSTDNDEYRSLSSTFHLLPILLLSTLSGLIGSLIDSILGATLQASLWSENKKVIVSEERKIPSSERTKLISGKKILNNHQVNFISSLATSLLAGLLGQLLF